MAAKELEIYIHIPFCIRKCLYCDFLSGSFDEKMQETYVNYLLHEIELEADTSYQDDTCVISPGEEPPKVSDVYEVSTIFIGGGTPSVLPQEAIGTILTKVRRSFRVLPDAEITIEVNPGTVDFEKFCAYKAMGINRVSIGCQSLNDDELLKLGRIHTEEDFYKAWEACEKAGFTNRNVDLMSGIPGQDEESYERTLRKIIELKPEHISAYSLIIEEGTPFYEMYPNGCVDEDSDRNLYALSGRILSENGYNRYEVSNYARKGFECRHNIGYWKRVSYLGFGVGAASLIDNVRFSNVADMRSYMYSLSDEGSDYLQNLGTYYHHAGSITPIPIKEQMSETMILGLRMTVGVQFDEFAKLYGKELLEVYGDIVRKHVENGLLENDGKRVFLTEKGFDLANYVMRDFI